MESLSYGFTPVCQENADTLVEIAFGLLHELSDIYDSGEANKTFRTMLQNLSGLMSDRASVMKPFDKTFNENRKTLLDIEENMEYLHCNAHFLLGMSTMSEKVLKESEKAKGEKLGRDAASKFSSWAATENSTCRYIRTACDIFGPCGDEKKWM